MSRKHMSILSISAVLAMGMTATALHTMPVRADETNGLKQTISNYPSYQKWYGG